MKFAKASGLLSFIAVSTLAGQVAHADESRWYVGANVGQSRAEIKTTEISDTILGAGFSATTTHEDDRDTGYKVFGGYQFNNHFSLEGGYFDLGEFNYSAVTIPAGTVDGTISLRGINLDLVGFAPITERLSAFGRLGVNYAETEDTFTGTGAANVADQNRKERNTNPKYGVGLQYAFNDNLAMRLEAERYRTNDAVANSKSNVDLISVGLVYHFGHKERKPAPIIESAHEPVAAAPAPQPRFEKYTASSTDLFEFNSAELRQPQPKLDEIADGLKASDEPHEVTIVGYTDNIGSKNYNRKLSERRAQAVKNYLVSRGVQADRLQVEGKGEADPVVVCREKNRAARIKCLQPNRRAQIDQITIDRKVTP